MSIHVGDFGEPSALLRAMKAEAELTAMAREVYGDTDGPGAAQRFMARWEGEERKTQKILGEMQREVLLAIVRQRVDP
ncbi:MAG: hypothetical protein JST28_09255 [Acidobacteria bacterium]|nr:hypothetical protein [Acidobacteriota bacterium]